MSAPPKRPRLDAPPPVADSLLLDALQSAWVGREAALAWAAADFFPGLVRGRLVRVRSPSPGAQYVVFLVLGASRAGGGGVWRLDCFDFFARSFARVSLGELSGSRPAPAELRALLEAAARVLPPLPDGVCAPSRVGALEACCEADRVLADQAAGHACCVLGGSGGAALWGSSGEHAAAVILRSWLVQDASGGGDAGSGGSSGAAAAPAVTTLASRSDLPPQWVPALAGGPEDAAALPPPLPPPWDLAPGSGEPVLPGCAFFAAVDPAAPGAPPAPPAGWRGIDIAGRGLGPNRVSERVTGQFRYALLPRCRCRRGSEDASAGAAGPPSAADLSPLRLAASLEADEYRPDVTAWRAVRRFVDDGVSLAVFRGAVLHHVDVRAAGRSQAPTAAAAAAAELPPAPPAPARTPLGHATRPLASPLQLFVVDADRLAAARCYAREGEGTPEARARAWLEAVCSGSVPCAAAGLPRTPHPVPAVPPDGAAPGDGGGAFEDAGSGHVVCGAGGAGALWPPSPAGLVWLTEEGLRAAVEPPAAAPPAAAVPTALDLFPWRLAAAASVSGAAAAGGAPASSSPLARASLPPGVALEPELRALLAALLPRQQQRQQQLRPLPLGTVPEGKDWCCRDVPSAAAEALRQLRAALAPPPSTPPAAAAAAAAAAASAPPPPVDADAFEACEAWLRHTSAAAPAAPLAPLLDAAALRAPGHPGAWHLFPPRTGRAPPVVLFHGTGADTAARLVRDGVLRRAACRGLRACQEGACDCNMNAFGVYLGGPAKARHYAVRRAVDDPRKLGAIVAVAADLGFVKVATPDPCPCGRCASRTPDGAGMRFVDHFGFWYSRCGYDTLYVRDGSLPATTTREWAVADPWRCRVVGVAIVDGAGN